MANVNHELIRVACRARLETLIVVSSGLLDLAATATGYTRADGGSFITDGFRMGMEVTPAGFVANTVDTLTDIAAGSVTSRAARTVEVSAPNRALLALLPSRRSWENIAIGDVPPGLPYIEEQYLPGPGTQQVGTGPLGQVEVLPQYVINVYVQAGIGPEALERYTQAIHDLFPSRYAVILSNGDVAHVRPELGPSIGQTHKGQPGFVCRTVSIPLRLRTFNSI